MISVRTDRIMMGVLLAGSLTTTAACSLVAEMRQAPPGKPASTVEQPPPPELMPSAPGTMSAPVATATASEPRVELQEQSRAPQTPPSAVERPSNDADDPRAVIDWLLNRASMRRR